MTALEDEFLLQNVHEIRLPVTAMTGGIDASVGTHQAEWSEGPSTRVGDKKKERKIECLATSSILHTSLQHPIRHTGMLSIGSPPRA